MANRSTEHQRDLNYAVDVGDDLTDGQHIALAIYALKDAVQSLSRGLAFGDDNWPGVLEHLAIEHGKLVEGTKDLAAGTHAIAEALVQATRPDAGYQECSGEYCDGCEECDAEANDIADAAARGE